MKGWRMSYDVGESTEGLEKSSFSNLFVASPTSQLILQPFRRFTYIKAHSPTLPLLHLRPPVLILQEAEWTSGPVWTRRSEEKSPLLRYPGSNLGRPARRPAPCRLSYLAHQSNMFLLQPFRCFTYVTAHSSILLSLLLRHRLFTYVTWEPPMIFIYYFYYGLDVKQLNFDAPPG